MACPMVSGIAALGLSYAKKLGKTFTREEFTSLLLSSVNDIDCLVIGHHGSKYSTSKEFLERTNPETAIISSGYNPYGHPSDEVIDRLTDKNVVIYRTDQVGSIEIKVR